MDSLGFMKACKHVGVVSLKNVGVLINAEDNNDYAFLAARGNSTANYAFAC